MFTRRFLNLLQGRLALMKREVWALELANNWQEGGAGQAYVRLRGRHRQPQTQARPLSPTLNSSSMAVTLSPGGT